MVHAISTTARGFDLKQGVRESPSSPMTLMIRLREAESAV
jgi:hypothetical protein